MTVTVTIFSWLLLCPVWNAFLTKTALGRFINAHISHTLNLLVAHILFWAIAVRFTSCPSRLAIRFRRAIMA